MMESSWKWILASAASVGLVALGFIIQAWECDCHCAAKLICKIFAPKDLSRHTACSHNFKDDISNCGDFWK